MKREAADPYLNYKSLLTPVKKKNLRGPIK